MSKISSIQSNPAKKKVIWKAGACPLCSPWDLCPFTCVRPSESKVVLMVMTNKSPDYGGHVPGVIDKFMTVERRSHPVQTVDMSACRSSELVQI